MRVGVLYRDDCWNVIYRATGIADALVGARVPVEVVAQGPRGELDAARLRACDVVHVYRRCEPSVVACAEDLRRRGVAITWDNDDDVRLLPPGSTKITRPQAERDFRAQVRMLRRADVVTTTSEVLAATYRRAGADDVRVIENHLQHFQRAEPVPHAGVVIGWVAADEHRADADALDVAGVLRRIMDAHPHVRVTTVGIRLGGLDPERYEHHRMIPFQQLKDVVRTFDVAIAPLADIPMSHARSNVKLKEYAAAGVPWLASARGPYRGLGTDQGGVLVGDDQWEERLGRMVSSSALRAQLRQRAQAWATSQLLQRHVGLWLEAFEDAIGHARARTGSAAAS